MSDEADRLRDRIVAEIELRQLYQLKAQRFEEALCKEVMEVVRKATAQAVYDSETDSETGSTEIEALEEENDRLRAEVKRLNGLFKKVEECRQNIIYCKRHPEDAYGIPNDYRADIFNQWMNRLKEAVESAREVQS